MRIVAGTLRGRRLKGPVSDAVRPTSDRLRETLFNVLGVTIRGSRVVDGFAGTGAVGLEALSRGAAHVTFFERDRRAWSVLEANIAHCDVGGRCRVCRSDFLRSEGRASVDLVFLDPPYDDDHLNDVLQVAVSHVAPDGMIVLEHRRARDTPELVESTPTMIRSRVLTSGDSALSFYRFDTAGSEE